MSPDLNVLKMQKQSLDSQSDYSKETDECEDAYNVKLCGLVSHLSILWTFKLQKVFVINAPEDEFSLMKEN